MELENKRNKVPIIEDNREHLMALAIKLRARDYVVASAGDGDTAIAAVTREKPDAIPLDLGLPAEDGFTVLDRLRSVIQIPIIIVSGRESTVNGERALAAGAVAFLRKPITTEQTITGSLTFHISLPTSYAALGLSRDAFWSLVAVCGAESLTISTLLRPPAPSCALCGLFGSSSQR